MSNNFVKITFLIFLTTLIYADQGRDISKVGPRTEKIEFNNYAKIYYVDQNASNNQSDGSKDNPWKNLSTALSKIKDQSENFRVALFVAAGCYGESTIKLQQYLDLYGGFDGKNWIRDIHKFTTILDGENSRRVVEGENNCRLDGFVIKNGLSRTHGGGILCDDTSPTISNCFITNNFVLEPDNFNHERIHQDAHHGAGIACFFNAVPEIRNNVFYENKTSIGNGAGVAFYGWLRIKGAPSTIIKNNIMEEGLRPVLKNNVFVQNVSGVNDIYRTRSSNGAAISCAFESRPIIENNIIASNQAKGRSDAGGVYSEYYSYPTIKGNWLVGNISDDDGGAIYTMKLGHASISDNFIAGNWTIGTGVGGIRISKEGRANIFDNIIVKNQTGGAVDCVDGYMELSNNIIMHNKGKSSIRYSNHFHYFRPSTIENNIIRENENKIIIETYGGENPIISNNNTDVDLDGEKNYDKAVGISDDLELANIKNITFNDKLYQSLIEVGKGIPTNSMLGRVVRINDYWSVINKVEKDKIYIWGNAELVAHDIEVIEVLSSYEIEIK